MITLNWYLAGATLYVVITDATGKYWNGSAFEAYNAAHWGTYAVALTESPAKTYAATFPVVAAGTYSIVAYSQAGGSPATTDAEAGYGDMVWNGTSETVASTGSSVITGIGVGV